MTKGIGRFRFTVTSWRNRQWRWGFNVGLPELLVFLGPWTVGMLWLPMWDAA